MLPIFDLSDFLKQGWVNKGEPLETEVTFQRVEKRNLYEHTSFYLVISLHWYSDFLPTKNKVFHQNLNLKTYLFQSLTQSPQKSLKQKNPKNKKTLPHQKVSVGTA